MLVKDEKCIFCKIATKEIPADFIYETDNFVVFPDIHPSAPVHNLIVPKKHYSSFLEVPDELWSEVKSIAGFLKEKFEHNGFRLGVNYGEAALISHMHVHYLAGITKTRKI